MMLFFLFYHRLKHTAMTFDPYISHSISPHKRIVRGYVLNVSLKTRLICAFERAIKSC